MGENTNALSVEYKVTYSDAYDIDADDHVDLETRIKNAIQEKSCPEIPKDAIEVVEAERINQES